MSPLVETLLAKSLEALKADKVSLPLFAAPFHDRSDLAERAEMLRREFAGQPELLLYHAYLVMLIRRHIDLALNMPRLESLWRLEGVFLRTHLDSRWLVSACDTIADHGQNPADRAWAVAGALFINTVKLYETERWAIGQNEGNRDYRQVNCAVPLYDGLTAYTIGRGDMIRNLLRRIAATPGDGVGALIFQELVRRALANDTVFKRFADVHRNPDTAW